MFDAALVELVAEHRADTAARRLLRLISGGFNDLPQEADNRVREHVRRRRRQLAVEIPHGGSSELEGVYAQVERAREIERPFLEIVPQANLTPQERRVVELRDQDLTQVVIAERLEISQPRVHQLGQAAIGKLGIEAALNAS